MSSTRVGALELSVVVGAAVGHLAGLHAGDKGDGTLGSSVGSWVGTFVSAFEGNGDGFPLISSYRDGASELVGVKSIVGTSTGGRVGAEVLGSIVGLDAVSSFSIGSLVGGGGVEGTGCVIGAELGGATVGFDVVPSSSLGTVDGAFADGVTCGALVGVTLTVVGIADGGALDGQVGDPLHFGSGGVGSLLGARAGVSLFVGFSVDSSMGSYLLGVGVGDAVLPLSVGLDVMSALSPGTLEGRDVGEKVSAVGVLVGSSDDA